MRRRERGGGGYCRSAAVENCGGFRGDNGTPSGPLNFERLSHLAVVVPSCVSVARRAGTQGWDSYTVQIEISFDI